MTSIIFKNISKFFPYESVHASDTFIVFEDKDLIWRNAINTALRKYRVSKYINCSPGYFSLQCDNKITLELHYNDFVNVYLTWWDNMIYIGFTIIPINFNKKEIYGILEKI